MNRQKLFLILISAFLLTGCSTKQSSTESRKIPQENTEAASNYYNKTIDVKNIVENRKSEIILSVKKNPKPGDVMSTVYVKADGDTIWSSDYTRLNDELDIGLTPVEIDGRNYLCEYCADIARGEGSYHYEIFSFDGSGKKIVYKKQSLDFSIGQMDKKIIGATIDEMRDYAKTIDGYLSGSIPIVYIDDDGIHYYPDTSYESCNFYKLCRYLTYTPSTSIEKNLSKIYSR